MLCLLRPMLAEEIAVQLKGLLCSFSMNVAWHVQLVAPMSVVALLASRR